MPSFIYTCVARGSTPLCEYTESKGNFQNVARTLLLKLHEKACVDSYNRGKRELEAQNLPFKLKEDLAENLQNNNSVEIQMAAVTQTVNSKSDSKSITVTNQQQHQVNQMLSDPCALNTLRSKPPFLNTPEKIKSPGKKPLLDNQSPGNDLRSCSELKRLSYIYDDYLFHFLVENNNSSFNAKFNNNSSDPNSISVSVSESAWGSSQPSLVYVVLADAQNGRRVPFAFLENLRKKFLTKFSSRSIPLPGIGSAKQLSLQKQFKNEMIELLYTFNSGHGDAISRVKNQINEIHEVMVENIDKILQRGEKIDLLVEKSEGLENDAQVFHRDARELRSIMWWRNFKVMCQIVILIVILIFVILWWHCGFKFDQC